LAESIFAADDAIAKRSTCGVVRCWFHRVCRIHWVNRFHRVNRFGRLSSAYSQFVSTALRAVGGTIAFILVQTRQHGYPLCSQFLRHEGIALRNTLGWLTITLNALVKAD